jgi:hypothetical protein
VEFGAGGGTRTRDTELGKLVLYQLSYARPGYGEKNDSRTTRRDGAAHERISSRTSSRFAFMTESS